jgi:hypothetical protein
VLTAAINKINKTDIFFILMLPGLLMCLKTPVFSTAAGLFYLDNSTFGNGLVVQKSVYPFDFMKK